MTVLVTGGAGYIGSHVVRLLTDRGTAVVVADDLVSGVVERIGDTPLLRLDLSADGATAALADFMRRHAVSSVLHFAARKQVGESMERPVWYYRQNMRGLENVLEAMDEVGVGRFVFSSSAAVYGATAIDRIGEDQPALPINPYGETKLAGEWLAAAWARSSRGASVALRYFNVAGAGWPDLADRVAHNLVPMIFEKLEAGRPPEIFGDAYPTPDGTCVRDYVHVLDLADAHLAALTALEAMPAGASAVYNVGTGSGTSVREMVATVARVTGLPFEPVVLPPRPGDPAVVVAATDLIARELGWTATHGLDDIVSSAWSARNA